MQGRIAAWLRSCAWSLPASVQILAVHSSEQVKLTFRVSVSSSELQRSEKGTSVSQDRLCFPALGPVPSSHVCSCHYVPPSTFLFRTTLRCCSQSRGLSSCVSVNSCWQCCVTKSSGSVQQQQVFLSFLVPWAHKPAGAQLTVCVLPF